MIRAVILKDVLWPQKQEDREEGGWRNPKEDKDVDPGHIQAQTDRDNQVSRRMSANGREASTDGFDVETRWSHSWGDDSEHTETSSRSRSVPLIEAPILKDGEKSNDDIV